MVKLVATRGWIEPGLLRGVLQILVLSSCSGLKISNLRKRFGETVIFNDRVMVSSIHWVESVVGPETLPSLCEPLPEFLLLQNRLSGLPVYGYLSQRVSVVVELSNFAFYFFGEGSSADSTRVWIANR